MENEGQEPRRSGLLARVDSVMQRGWPGALVPALAALALVLVAWIWRNDPSPDGVVDLALAGTVDGATDVVDGWVGVERTDALRAIDLDRWLIPVYGVGIALTSLWGRVRLRSGPLRTAAAVVALAMPLAMALDVLENVAIRVMVTQAPREPWPLVAASAGWAKFFIVLPAAAFAAGAWGARVKGAVQDRFRALERATGSLLPQTPPRPEEREPPRADVGDDPGWRRNQWRPSPGRIGICCSGGGIRSAAFNLGALQALQQPEHAVFQRASYLAAVSGGAYIASAHTIVCGATSQELLEEEPALALGSPEDRYLRAHLDYLAVGLKGKAWFAIRVLMGTLVNLLFFLMVLFVVSRPLGWIYRTDAYDLDPIRRTLTIGPHLWVVVGAPGLVAVSLGVFAIVRRFQRKSRYRLTGEAAGAFALLFTTMFLVLIALPWLVKVVPAAAQWLFQPVIEDSAAAERPTAKIYAWLAQLVGVAVASGAVFRLVKNQSSRIALLIAGLLVPAMTLLTLVLFVSDAAARGPTGPMTIAGIRVGIQVAWLGGVAVALLSFYAISDLTTWSMHPFYRRRLGSAFALRRTTSKAAEPMDYDSPEKLRLSQFSGAPELVVCGAANVSNHVTAVGRYAVPFTFGPQEIGGRDVGWIRTRQMEGVMRPRRLEDVTLPAAVAISGAALSPSMGRFTRPALRALLTLANVRLGVWLPNPRWVLRYQQENEGTPQTPDVKWKQRPRVQYLVKELLGIHRGDDMFLYVTDGGHWENLGLVELLRRGCTEIYCFDAAGDKPNTFFTLGEAIALARTELGVEIDIDPEGMEPKKLDLTGAEPLATRTAHDHVRAGFRYPDGQRGWIVYGRPAVTASAPWDVKAFGEKDPHFPSHGTADQFYTDDRFEAYRALGFHVADGAAKTMKAWKLRETLVKANSGV